MDFLMLSQLLSMLSRILSPAKSMPTSSDSSVSAVSSSVQSQGLSSNNAFLSELTAQLRRDEGKRLHAYQDHLGYWTIGYGRLIDKRKGGGITNEEADYLLKNDIDRKLSEIRNKYPHFDKLDDARKGVLMNMAFQMGVDGLLKFNKTLTLIEQGKYKEAADNMLKSLWAKQTPARAERMAKQMRSGTWQ
jgi:lysozyme